MSQECLLTEWIRREVMERMEAKPTPFSFGDIQREIIEEASKQINFTITNYAKMFEMMG